MQLPAGAPVSTQLADGSSFQSTLFTQEPASRAAVLLLPGASDEQHSVRLVFGKGATQIAATAAPAEPNALALPAVGRERLASRQAKAEQEVARVLASVNPAASAFAQLVFALRAAGAPSLPSATRARQVEAAAAEMRSAPRRVRRRRPSAPHARRPPQASTRRWPPARISLPRARC